MKLKFLILFYLIHIAPLIGNQDVKQVVILGSGPAGLTAAIYTARAGLSTWVIEGETPGGLLSYANQVDNFPGFPEGINGYELQENMREQAMRFGVHVESDHVTALDLSQRPFALTLEEGNLIFAEALIVATGTIPKTLGIDSEETLKGKGVGICAFCDAILFKDKDVVIIGNGNMALDEALLLSQYASSVTIISETDSFEAAYHLKEAVFATSNIQVIWNHTVENIFDPQLGKVTGVLLKGVQSNEVRFHPCSGIFVTIGYQPNTHLFKGQLELDSEGYIVTQTKTTQTNVPGVFAAGTVACSRYKQAITAAASGCMAGIDAYYFLLEHK